MSEHSLTPSNNHSDHSEASESDHERSYSDSSIEEESDQSEYESQEKAEDFEDYKIDGYHPVVLGELFNGKYQAIQKLGWGHFSTVWLVNERMTNNYFALKIQKSKKSYSESALDELEILKVIEQNSTSHEWHETVLDWNNKFELTMLPCDTFNIRLVDNFCHVGMHGKHYCSVFNIMGPNLLDVIQYFESREEGMDIRLVKIITRQILMGLDYMHRICKIIHTDLKPENIMLELQGKQLEEFISDLKKYKKKPLSMKFLDKLQTTSSKKKIIQKQKLKVQMAKQSQQGNIQGGENSMQIETLGEGYSEPSNFANHYHSQSADVMAEEYSGMTYYSQQSEYEGYTGYSYEDYLSNRIEIEPEKNNNKSHHVEESTTGGFGHCELSTKVSDRYTVGSDSDGSKVQEETKESFENWSYKMKWKGNIKVKLDQNVRIKIVDFGNACYSHKHFTDNIQTREYRSPEAILGIPYQGNTDIWSLACIVYEMLTTNFLFKPHKGEGYSKSDEHLALMMEHLGRMPRDLALSGAYSRDYFDENGNLIYIKNLEETSLYNALRENEYVDEEDAKEIMQFLLPMLEFDPEKRISAYDALQSEWLWT